MDLREKPGKLQTLLEVFMRIRLISITALVIVTISIMASNWGAVVSLPAGASSALAEWMIENGVAQIWNSSQYLLVAAIATVVLFFVFGHVRGGLSAIISIGLFIGSLVLMDGNDRVPLFFLLALVVLSLILILFVKLGVACGLFPFVLGFLFLSSLIGVLQPSLEPSYLVWASLCALGFAGTMGISTVAAKYLKEGMPQAGALIKAAKQMVIPMLVSSLLVIAAIAVDMPVASEEGVKDINIWGGILFFFVFNLWFFVIQFPIMTFAPWERLRSASRKVDLNSKKKPKKSTKKK